MQSSGILLRVALLRTDISEERITSISSHVLRLLVTDNVLRSPSLGILMMEALCSSEMSVLTRGTRRQIPKHIILHWIFIYFSMEK
jgi:hypothetical protein